MMEIPEGSSKMNVLSTVDSWAIFLATHGMINPTSEEPEKREVGNNFIEFTEFLSSTDDSLDVLEHMSELNSQRIDQLWKLFSLINYSEATGNSYHPTERTAALFIGEIIRTIDERQLLDRDKSLLKLAATDLSLCLFSIGQSQSGNPVGLATNSANIMMRKGHGKNGRDNWIAQRQSDTGRTLVYAESTTNPERVGRACFTINPINPDGVTGREFALGKSADQASIQQTIETTTYRVDYSQYPDKGKEDATVAFEVKERLKPNSEVERFVSITL